MRDAGHQVDKTHRVADSRLLFGNRLVCLAVGLIFHHPRGAVGVPVGRFTALFILMVVEVRLLTAFFNEVVHQRQVARFLRDFVQAHQRQLNFRVTRIAVDLVIPGAEDLIDVVG